MDDDAPPGVAILEAVLLARPPMAEPSTLPREMLTLPLDFILQLIRYVRRLERGVEASAPSPGVGDSGGVPDGPQPPP